CEGKVPEAIRPFSSFEVIGSSNGLLCVKFILGTAHYEIAVWNPLTQTRISTHDPSSKQKDFALSQYAFGHIFGTLYYVVVHVSKKTFADRTLNWSIFSSVTNNWNIKGSFEGDFEKLGPTYVVHKGVVYWTGWEGVAIPKPKCIVSFNLRNKPVVQVEIPDRVKSSFHTLSIIKDEVAFYEGQITTVVDAYQVTRTESSGSSWGKLFRIPAVSVPFTPTMFMGKYLLNVMESRSGPYNSKDAERTDLLIAKHDYEADRSTTLLSTWWREIVHLRTVTLHSPRMYPIIPEPKK
ncbi:hypothetical protein PIB30_033734, partial [Stylosanthes scabra]|nr:hypothetical protein [Stylosanthes scabra]